MKAGVHPALAQGKVRYVGDHVAVVIAETLAQAKDAAECVSVEYERAARRGRCGHRPERRPAADPRRGPQQHGLSVAPGRQGQGRCGLRRRQARHQDRPRQQPADPQRHRAARGDRRVRLRPGEPHALHHQPEPARRAPGAGGLHRPRARAQAARDRARRRRRLRLQDLHLRRGDRVPVGLAQGQPPRQVGGRAHRVLPRRRARPRPRHDSRAGARRQRQDPGAAGQDQGQPRRLSLDLRLLGADLSLRAAAVGPVRHPRHLLRGRRRLHQHRAGRCLSRRRPTRGDLRGRAAGGGGGAADRPGPRRVPPQELHQDASRTPRPSS